MGDMITGPIVNDLWVVAYCSKET